MRELAIALKGGGVEIDGAIGCDVGVVRVNQLLDEVDHALDLLRGLRMRRCGLNVHGRHVFFHLGDITLRDGRAVHALFIGLFDDFIVYVCVV